MNSIPKNRLEMERNINRLKSYPLRITERNFRTVRDVKKAQYLSNGRVNLLTIEVEAKMLSNMIDDIRNDKT